MQTWIWVTREPQSLLSTNQTGYDYIIVCVFVVVVLFRFAIVFCVAARCRCWYCLFKYARNSLKRTKRTINAIQYTHDSNIWRRPQRKKFLRRWKVNCEVNCWYEFLASGDKLICFICMWWLISVCLIALRSWIVGVCECAYSKQQASGSKERQNDREREGGGNTATTQLVTLFTLNII